jgi:hypothetical protein
MPRQLILGSARAFLALALIGCHGGAPGGAGAPCATDKPCRAAFTCVAGRCQPSDGGLPDSPDLGTDSTDLRAENPVDGPHDVLTPSEAGDHPIEAPTEKPDAAPDRPDSPPDTQPDRPGDAPRDAAGDIPDGDGRVDTRPDAPLRCDHEQAFTSIALVGGIGAGPGLFDGAARLSPDEKRVFLTSTRTGTYQIYEATRGSRDVDFMLPINLVELNTSWFDFNPTVTGDGVTMFFESSRTGNFTIHTSIRATPGGEWAMPTLFVPVVSGTSNNGMPYVLPKGDVLYFQSDRSGPLHVFRTARGANGTWSVPQLASGFSGNYEFSPVVPEDELTMYFATDYGKVEEAAADGGVPEIGDYDVWVATRKTKGEAFSSPRRVVGINTTMGETPSWISPDACRLYFARRIRNSSDSRIYVATRTPR